MEELEDSWYDEDDASEVEEDLNFDNGKKDWKNQSAQCPECKKVFTQKSSMKHHFRSTHQGITYKPGQCPECRKVFTQKSSMKLHLRFSEQFIKVSNLIIALNVEKSSLGGQLWSVISGQFIKV